MTAKELKEFAELIAQWAERCEAAGLVRKITRAEVPAAGGSATATSRARRHSSRRASYREQTLRGIADSIPIFISADLVAHFYLAVALVHLGRFDEARASLQAGLALDPTFTVHRWRGIKISDNRTFMAQRQRIEEGLRKAGVPEE
jgi:hypothetical protein